MVLKKTLTNYVLSIGFILLAVMFLTALFAITQFVLADSEQIQDHVMSTRDLLDEIDEVEKATTELNLTAPEDSNTFIYLNQSIVGVESSSFKNIRDDRTVFTFVFTKPVFQAGSNYYVAVSNLSILKEGDVIVYAENLSALYVSAIADEDNHYLYDPQIDDFFKVSSTDIRGMVFYRE